MSTMSPDANTEQGRPGTLQDARDFFARRGLCRSRDEQLLGGVCSGLGRRVGLGPWPARLLFLLVLMVLPGSQLLVYPVLWVLLPLEQAPTAGATWTSAIEPASAADSPGATDVGSSS